ncbi:MAG: hypothetical protein LBC26_02970, partial [Oscillospiraceae bacterium]|nr:hypothetical protein [Oscillospiraceae bacterium]
MELRLRNIGKIRQADVVLDGITVIAGENNTGKSTVGKALYSVFSSFYKIQEQIDQERREGVLRMLYALDFSASNDFIQQLKLDELVESILASARKDLQDIQTMRTAIFDLLIQNNKDFSSAKKLSETIDKMIEILRISDAEIFKTVLNKILSDEFYGQITNIDLPDEPGVIGLQTNETDTSVSIEIIHNQIVKISEPLNLT